MVDQLYGHYREVDNQLGRGITYDQVDKHEMLIDMEKMKARDGAGDFNGYINKFKAHPARFEVINDLTTTCSKFKREPARNFKSQVKQGLDLMKQLIQFENSTVSENAFHVTYPDQTDYLYQRKDIAIQDFNG